jgi:hypothetical protein
MIKAVIRRGKARPPTIQNLEFDQPLPARELTEPASGCCLDPAAGDVKIAPRQNRPYGRTR